MPSFIIYHKETTVIVFERQFGSYATETAAKAGRTRMAKKGKINAADYEVAEKSYFHDNIEKTVTKKNLMSGKEFTQPVNTPPYCDPSMESYWSM